MRYSQPAHQFDLCQMGAAAAAEPFFQYDRRRRQDENPDRVRLQAPDLLSTLDVNNENEIPPSIKMSSSVDCTGAIKMAEHLRRLQKLTTGSARLKLRS